MITIIFIVITLVIAGLFLFKNPPTKKVQTQFSGSTTELVTRNVAIAVAIFFGGIIFSLIQPFNLERVDAGHVGIKVNLTGDARGVSKFEYKTGWVVINTWIAKLYEFPTFQQGIEYPEQVVITKGGFQTTIHPSFNYSINPGNIGDMFSNLRLSVKEVEQGWLKNAIIGAVNDVANLWTVDDIFNHRAQFESDIFRETNKKVGRWFHISQLRTNIKPPEALVQAIESKTKAIQEAQAAEAQVAVAEANGRKMVAESQADSAQRVIRAAGEAEEMRRKQVALTSEYVEFLKVQKWDGVNSQVVAGSGGGLLINVGGKN